jgi:hypothetical protein
MRVLPQFVPEELTAVVAGTTEDVVAAHTMLIETLFSMGVMFALRGTSPAKYFTVELQGAVAGTSMEMGMVFDCPGARVRPFSVVP